MRSVILVGLAVASTLGCGPAALPSATPKMVAPANVVGKWQYTADYGKIPVTLEMKVDGTFAQTVKRGGPFKCIAAIGLWTEVIYG